MLRKLSLPLLARHGMAKPLECGMLLFLSAPLRPTPQTIIVNCSNYLRLRSTLISGTLSVTPRVARYKLMLVFREIVRPENIKGGIGKTTTVEVSMPKISEYIEKIRPQETDSLFYGWQTLTHADNKA